MDKDCFAITYVDSRTGLHGVSPEVYKAASSEAELVAWYESRHKYARVTSVTPI